MGCDDGAGLVDLVEVLGSSACGVLFCTESQTRVPCQGLAGQRGARPTAPTSCITTTPNE